MLYTINFVLFVLLSFMWSDKNFLNFFIKVCIFGIACANAFCALQVFGYLNK